MKFFHVMLLLVAIPSAIHSQTPSEEEERQRIVQNRISKSIQWNHRYTQGRPNPTGFRAVETIYDRRGNPIEIINFRANGDTSSRVVYRYNAQNQRVEYLLFQKQDRPFIELSYKQSINYNEQGRRNLEVVFDGTSTHRILFTYFPNGKPKETTKIAPGNRVEERWVYTEKEPNTTEINVFIPDGVLSFSLTRRFDPKGNLLSETRRNPTGDETRRVEYAYDATGRTIQMSEFSARNLVRRLHYTYDRKGQLVEIVQEMPDGRRFTQSSFRYDNDGNILEERWVEGDTNIFSHKLSTYNQSGALKELDSFYAPYNFKVLYRYTYEYF